MAMPEGEAGEPESGRGARTRAARSTMAEADLTTCSIAQARVDRKGRRITPRLVPSAGERGVRHAVSRRATDQHYRRRATTGTLFSESLVGAARLPVELGKPGRGIPGCALASATGSTATCRPLFPWSAVRINPAGPGPGRAATSRGRPGTRPLRRGSATPSPSPPPGGRSLARRPRPRARNQSPK